MSEWWLIPLVFLIALLYASVGHGGASGYLAALSWFGWPPNEMATTALTLNVLVAGVALATLIRAGYLSWRLTWPFVAASIPAAALGGAWKVSAPLYALLLSGSLLVAALRLMMRARDDHAQAPRSPAPAMSLPVGGVIGWLSGVVGIGGGIFLSPVLLLCRWATLKQAAASSACMIVLNSAAALAGRLATGSMAYGNVWPLALAALGGGVIGSRLGANHFSGTLLKRMLAIALLVASLKLLKVAMGS